MTQLCDLDHTQMLALTDILVAAGYSDSTFRRVERHVIVEILTRITAPASLSVEITGRIATATSEDLDVPAAVTALGLSTLVERRALLCAILRVLDADGVVADAEDDYLEHVADLLAVPHEELMVIEYETDGGSVDR